MEARPRFRTSGPSMRGPAFHPVWTALSQKTPPRRAVDASPTPSTRRRTRSQTRWCTRPCVRCVCGANSGPWEGNTGPDSGRAVPLTLAGIHITERESRRTSVRPMPCVEIRQTPSNERKAEIELPEREVNTAKVIAGVPATSPIVTHEMLVKYKRCTAKHPYIAEVLARKNGWIKQFICSRMQLYINTKAT